MKNVCMHACMSVCMRVCLYLCLPICMYLSMYLRIYVSVYLNSKAVPKTSQPPPVDKQAKFKRVLAEKLRCRLRNLDSR